MDGGLPRAIRGGLPVLAVNSAYQPASERSPGTCSPAGARGPMPLALFVETFGPGGNGPRLATQRRPVSANDQRRRARSPRIAIRCTGLQRGRRGVDSTAIRAFLIRIASRRTAISCRGLSTSSPRRTRASRLAIARALTIVTAVTAWEIAWSTAARAPCGQATGFVRPTVGEHAARVGWCLRLTALT